MLKRDPDAVGYAAVDKYLNPPHPAEGAARIAGIFGLLSHIISVGWIGCKRALVTGQCVMVWWCDSVWLPWWLVVMVVAYVIPPPPNNKKKGALLHVRLRSPEDAVHMILLYM